MTKFFEITKAYKIVEQILRDNPETRNDDRKLMFLVLKQNCQQVKTDITGCDWLLVGLDNLKKCPSFETITRVRRKIQNDEGRFLPTELWIRKQRRIAEADFIRWASKERAMV